MKNRVGELIRKSRGELSLRDFADNCEVSHKTIDNYEKGFDSRTNKPIRHTVDTLAKIALGGKISLNDLLQASVEDMTDTELSEEVNVSTNSLILAAHRKEGVDELPKEAQEKLDEYIELLRMKYKKK